MHDVTIMNVGSRKKDEDGRFEHAALQRLLHRCRSLAGEVWESDGLTLSH